MSESKEESKAAAGEAESKKTETKKETKGKDVKGDKKDDKAAAPGEKQHSKNYRGGKNNKDETPIEELFDLSKPIPRVPKPSKEEHDKKIAEFDAQINKIKEAKEAVQKKIEGMHDKNKKTGLGKEKDELQKLRQKKFQLIEEKKKIKEKFEATKGQADKIMKDKNTTKANVRFTKLEDIEKEIKKLQRKQETTTMTLNEEKKLIKEMDGLMASKKFVAQLKDSESAFENIKEQKKNIGAAISAKDKEIDAIAKQINEKQASIDKMNSKETDKKGLLQAAFDERDALRKKINAIIKEKDKARDEFREATDKFYKHQRALKAQQKIQYEEEKKRRDEEHQEYLKKLEEEELKKVPYEEEQALCLYLAEYLTRTYLNDNTQQDDADKKSEDVVEVKEDPFAGMKAVGRKTQEEEDYFAKGKGKKKRNRANKKQSKAAAGPFTLSVDTFEQFGWIGLSPPTAIGMVQKSVDDLKAKKEWYSKQPRGSVPTAADIRKANEKANKIRPSDNGASEKQKGKASANKNKKDFTLSDDDFVPLGNGTSTATINSSWGQKGTTSAPQATPNDLEKAGEAQPTPAETAAKKAEADKAKEESKPAKTAAEIVAKS